MKKLIDLSDATIKALKLDASKNGRSLKKHIEYLLDQRAIEVNSIVKKGKEKFGDISAKP